MFFKVVNLENMRGSHHFSIVVTPSNARGLPHETRCRRNIKTRLVDALLKDQDQLPPLPRWKVEAELPEGRGKSEGDPRENWHFSGKIMEHHLSIELKIQKNVD